MKRSAFYREVFGAKGVEGDLEYHGRASECIVVPDSLIFAGDLLSLGEKILWLALLWHCQKRNPDTRVCWPSRETLALMVGKQPRQVSTYIKGLYQKGCLEIRRRLQAPPYYLLKDPSWDKLNRTKGLIRLTQGKVIEKRIMPKASLRPAPVCSSPPKEDAQKGLTE